MDRYSKDVLTPGWQKAHLKQTRDVAVELDQVVEFDDFCGAVVGWENGLVVLEDRKGKRRSAPFGPGFLLALLYILYIAIICWIKPDYGPAETESKHTGAEKISMFTKSIVPPIVLVFIVLGSIVAGIATPTEAAGMGCAGAIVLAVGILIGGA